MASSPSTTRMVESQLEVLRSEKIATAVIDQLKLGDNPAFNGGPPSLLSRLFSLLRSKKSDAVDEFAKQRSILGQLQGGLAVRRVGLSYAIDIQYRSPNPELAAKIANATADAYVDRADRGESAVYQVRADSGSRSASTSFAGR